MGNEMAKGYAVLIPCAFPLLAERVFLWRYGRIEWGALKAEGRKMKTLKMLDIEAYNDGRHMNMYRRNLFWAAGTVPGYGVAEDDCFGIFLRLKRSGSGCIGFAAGLSVGGCVCHFFRGMDARINVRMCRFYDPLKDFFWQV